MCGREIDFPQGLERLLKKSEKQIPRRAKQAAEKVVYFGCALLAIRFFRCKKRSFFGFGVSAVAFFALQTHFSPRLLRAN